MTADLVTCLNGAQRKAKELMTFLGLKGASRTTLHRLVDCCDDAAVEITRLRAELAEAREVRPQVVHASHLTDGVLCIEFDGGAVDVYPDGRAAWKIGGSSGSGQALAAMVKGD